MLLAQGHMESVSVSNYNYNYIACLNCTHLNCLYCIHVITVKGSIINYDYFFIFSKAFCC